MTVIPERTEPQDLLTPEFLRKLERLRLVSRRAFAGKTWGERRSKKRGASVEFADFRNYTHGDDLRHLDWNAFARLDRLFLKLFVEEEDLSVYLLVDASRSMAFGDPPKFDYARRTAGALGYLALCNFDRVTFWSYGERLRGVFGPTRGRGRALAGLRWLAGLEADGATASGAALREFALRTKRPGLAIVISDFFDADHLEGLKALASRQFEVAALHLLDADELRPALAGDLKLVDSETGAEREITVTQGLLRAYQHSLAEFCGGLDATCRALGIHLLRVSTAEPFENLILRYLRKRGIIE
jgi:uncharacterized protein (DUF58 family)